MKYSDLNIRERAALIKLGVANGLHTLDEIRTMYNQYSEGGDMSTPEEVNNTEGEETYYAGQLPEVRVTPSRQDKAALSTIRKNIPDKSTRDYILQLLDDYNTDYNFDKVDELHTFNTGKEAEDFIDTQDGDAIFGYDKDTGAYNVHVVSKYHPSKDSYKNNINDLATRTSELYRLSGRPKVYSTPSLIAKINGIFGTDNGMASVRPHMNPITNSMHNIRDFNSFVAELSHSYNKKNIPTQGYYGLLGAISGSNGGENSVYNRPFNLEHTTHKVTEPLLIQYIKNGEAADIFDNIVDTPEGINESINRTVDSYKSQYNHPYLHQIKEAAKDVLNLHSTGGPLYPFSFSKQPIPEVRY